MWLPSKIAKERIGKRKTRVGAGINSFPLLGVAITLLVILMLLPGNSGHHWAGADLALTASATPQPRANREDAMRVTIARDGAVFFRNMKVATADLPSLIREGVKNGAERRVYASVDARAKYADVEPVIDKIREAGIHDITFLTEKRQPSPASTQS